MDGFDDSNTPCFSFHPLLFPMLEAMAYLIDEFSRKYSSSFPVFLLRSTCLQEISILGSSLLCGERNPYQLRYKLVSTNSALTRLRCFHPSTIYWYKSSDFPPSFRLIGMTPMSNSYFISLVLFLVFLFFIISWGNY